MELSQDGSPSSSDLDVDSILESAHTPSGDRAMHETPPPQPSETPPTQPTEYEYDWRGQKIKEPLDMILKRASMGRDYAQNTEDLKKERSDWEKQRQENDKKYQRYREVDDYIKQNPQWWEAIERSYQQARGQASHASPESLKDNAALKPILDQVGEMKTFISELQQERLDQKVKQEDDKLTTEIKSIRQKYGDLDWDTPDREGKSLEYRVVEHATKSGINSFRAAFLDFYHPELEKKWESRGREAIAKDAQKKTRLGLLGESPTPKKGISQAQNIKSRSYDDLTREAMEELGL